MPRNGIGGEPTLSQVEEGHGLPNGVTVSILSQVRHSFALLTWVGYPLITNVTQVLTFFVAPAGPNRDEAHRAHTSGIWPCVVLSSVFQYPECRLGFMREGCGDRGFQSQSFGASYLSIRSNVWNRDIDRILN